MSNRRPPISNKIKICIICEGNEEYSYLHKLISLNLWHNQYDFTLDNANGNGNIPARYQDFYQNDSYDLVLVFCDTEKKPYEQYADIKRKINEIHGIENAADLVIIFGNPCTMQIIVKHWSDIIIKTPAKSINASIIKQYAHIENYKGRADQVQAIMETITKENYASMYKRVKNLNKIDTIHGSSNFDLFIDYFESADSVWIDKINHALENDLST